MLRSLPLTLGRRMLILTPLGEMTIASILFTIKQELFGNIYTLSLHTSIKLLSLLPTHTYFLAST